MALPKCHDVNMNDIEDDKKLRDWNSKSVPPDLRKRVVYCYRKGQDVSSIADRLLVSQSACYRYIDRWKQTGQVYSEKEILQQCGAYRHPVDRHPEILEQVLHSKSTTYLKEYKQELHGHGIIASEPTICRFWQNEQETVKRASVIAKESSWSDYVRFWGEVDTLFTEPNQGIWLDEMSTNDLDTVRPRGRSKKGQRCYQISNLTRGHFRFSTEIATDITGPLAYQVFDGSADKINFVDFLWTSLYDVVTPYPGPRSILFPDNHTIHRNEEFEEFVQETKILSIWLPAYLPFLNLTEWVNAGIRMIQEEHDDAKGYDQSLLTLVHAVECMKNRKWSIAARKIGYPV